MAYKLPEWIEFAKQLDRFTIIEIPVTATALKKAVPGSKGYCTIANATSEYTGMDASLYQIEVDAQYIKFVIDGWRYFLIMEVVGQEHIKKLDTLAFHENGQVNLEDFEPFDLKVKLHDKKEVHLRPATARPKIVVSAQSPSENGGVQVQAPKNNKKNKDKQEEAIPSAPVIAAVRRQRSDAGQQKKSRWSI
jgi:hypothetical protein